MNLSTNHLQVLCCYKVDNSFIRINLSLKDQKHHTHCTLDKHPQN